MQIVLKTECVIKAQKGLILIRPFFKKEKKEIFKSEFELQRKVQVFKKISGDNLWI